MNHLISFNVSENCLICNQFGDFSKKMYLLSTTFTIYSKKPLHEIIETIFDTCSISEDSSICEKCFNKINEFDHHTLEATKMRNELIGFHEKSKSTEYHIDIEDAFQTNEFNIFESDSNGISIVQGHETSLNIKHAKLNEIKKTEDEISDEFKKVIENEGIKYDFEVFKRAFGNDEDDDKKECASCGIKFRTSTSFLIHIASDHDKITCQIPCWVCNKKCPDKLALRAHLICHKNIKKYECYCGKKFMYKLSYTQHLKIHDNVREFACQYDDLCSFKAFTLSHLKRHIRARHTKEKNHQCKFCGRSFAELYNMKSHVKKQHQQSVIV